MKKRIYVRIGLGITAVAVLILPTYVSTPLLSIPTAPKILWNYQSEIAWAYIIVWIIGSAFLANGFFFSLLSASLDVRDWRIALAMTLLTFLTVAPVTAVAILLIVHVMLDEPVKPIMLKILSVGAVVYIVVLYFVFVRLPWRREFWRLVTGWERWRAGLFGFLSCSYMGFLAWMGLIQYFAILK